MKFYRHWARHQENITVSNETVNLVSYGYSNMSLEDAMQVARERARSNSARIFGQGAGDTLYYNADRVFREEIIAELQADDGERAVISRNSYGCLVLNTPNVFFADIDLPNDRKGFVERLADWFASLFGSNVESPTSENEFESILIDRINRLISIQPELVIRLYRTFHGFRAMIVSETIPSQIAKSGDYLKELGTDKLYVSLCRSQQCYRARISPKPWRIGLFKPGVRFPYIEPSERKAMEDWLSVYETTSAKYATCALIGNFGDGRIDSTCQQIADVHDSFVLNHDFPLA